MLDIANAARSRAEQLVGSKGCVEPFSVKVKPFPPGRENDIAMYRHVSQFTSKPTFWVNEAIPGKVAERGIDPSMIPEIVEDSLLHEYGHVIAELGTKRDPELASLVNDVFPGDEERFAETFIDYVRGRVVDIRSEEACGRVMARYCDLIRA